MSKEEVEKSLLGWTSGVRKCLGLAPTTEMLMDNTYVINLGYSLAICLIKKLENVRKWIKKEKGKWKERSYQQVFMTL